MAQKSKSVTVEAYLERLTLHDKKSNFRASYPPEYHVRIINRIAGVSIIIVREFIFKTKAEQTAHYNHLKGTYGL